MGLCRSAPISHSCYYYRHDGYSDTARWDQYLWRAACHRFHERVAASSRYATRDAGHAAPGRLLQLYADGRTSAFAESVRDVRALSLSREEALRRLDNAVSNTGTLCTASADPAAGTRRVVSHG